jgi:dephospho-CoA kinase
VSTPLLDGGVARPLHTIAVVGLAGTGKSAVTRLLVDEHGYVPIYFGGVVVGEVRRRGLDVTEANERVVREELRETHGSAVMAQLSLPAIEEALGAARPVVIDGVYSGAEWELLRLRLRVPLRLVAVHASRRLREERLAARPERPLSPAELRSRDLREVETLDKAVPIALADHHLINNRGLAELHAGLLGVLAEVWAEVG